VVADVAGPRDAAAAQVVAARADADVAAQAAARGVVVRAAVVAAQAAARDAVARAAVVAGRVAVRDAADAAATRAAATARAATCSRT